MAQAYAIPATAAHAAVIAARLRPADAAEVAAECHGTPPVVLRWLLKHSDCARTLFIDHREAAMFGVLLRDDSIAVPWVLTTGVVDRFPVAFWQASKYALWMMRQRYPVLSQCIDARYEKALRWIARLGFRIEDAPHPCGGHRMPFFKATYNARA